MSIPSKPSTTIVSTTIVSTANPAVTTPAATATYAANFAALSALAEKLKNATGSTTVDTLVADVQAARRAYAVCRERLEAVRREIDAEVNASAADTAA